MSRLIQAIKATPTGKERHKPLGPLSVMAITNNVMLTKDGRQLEYRVEVALGSTGWVDRGEHQADMRDSVVRMNRLRVQEEVYGEFRDPLYRTLEALYHGDTDDALSIVRGILSSMFEHQP